MLSRVCFVLTDIASPVDQTGEAFLFLLVSLIEKGKKRYNQTSKAISKLKTPIIIEIISKAVIITHRLRSRFGPR